MTPSTLRLTMLGQALIQHDLRSEPWPDFAALAAMFGQADLCFTDQEKQSAAGRRKRRRARGIDAGASLYVSHGAPRLHGIEIYRGRPIFYNLGNLIFRRRRRTGYYDDAVWQVIIAGCRSVGRQFRT